MASRQLLVPYVLALLLLVPASARSAPGVLLWQDRLPVPPGGCSNDLKTVGNQLIVAGYGGNSPLSLDFAVRTYDRRSGALLWQDRYDRAGRFDGADAVAVHGSLAFVAGGSSSASRNRDALIRAYDVRTGVLVWQNFFDRAGGFDQFTYHTIAVAGGRVFAGGFASEANGNPDWCIRAYDESTGRLLWQDLYDGGDLDHPESIAAEGNLVVASGLTTDPTGKRHFTVRAYDARRGDLLWQDQVSTGMRVDAFVADVAFKVQLQGGLVVAAGSISDATGVHLAVRTYRAATGALLWSDLLDEGAGADVAFDMALDGGMVYVAGSGGPESSVFDASNADWLLRAYDAQTGVLLWKRQVDGFGADDQPNVLGVQGNRVVVAGTVATADGAFNWRVLALEAATGNPVWQDDLAVPEAFAFANSLDIQGDSVYVGGFVQDALGNSVWIVRAYALR